MREGYTKIFESELQNIKGVFERDNRQQLDEGVKDWIKKAIAAPKKVKDFVMRNPKKSALIASIGAFITYALVNPEGAAEALDNIKDSLGMGGEVAPDVAANAADASGNLEVLKGEEFRNIVNSLNDAFTQDPTIVDTPEELHNSLNRFMSGIVKIPGVTEDIAQKAVDTVKAFQSIDDETVRTSFEMMKQGGEMAKDASEMVSQAADTVGG